MIHFFWKAGERSIRLNSEYKTRFGEIFESALKYYSQGQVNTQKWHEIAISREEILGPEDLHTLEAKEYLARALNKKW